MHTMSNFEQIEIDAVVEERTYSEKWGDAFDSLNTLNDWVTYICIYASESAKMCRQGDPSAQYSKLIKAANLALTAAKRVRTETIAKRHYDE